MVYLTMNFLQVYQVAAPTCETFVTTTVSPLIPKTDNLRSKPFPSKVDPQDEAKYGVNGLLFTPH